MEEWSARERTRAAEDKQYHRQVGDALDDTLSGAEEVEQEEGAAVLDPASDRYIILSDLHKGTRDGADDFRYCERAYNAALAYYYAAGHTLVELGDVEELWEESPAAVIKAYRYSLELAARFHAEGRYVRIWGNHDDAWSFPGRVRRHLRPIFQGPELRVREGYLLRVIDEGEPLGTLFLVHGHQGTSASDRWKWLSRLVVRFLWRPLQRRLKLSLNTPAKDWVLRERHNIALSTWAAAQEGVVLIAGHTHRPVFLSETHAAEIARELEAAEENLRAAPRNADRQKRVAELRAELEWVRAQEVQKITGAGPEGTTLTEDRSYFNTGCCAFSDGDITGLEIADGQIRLVRWPNNQDEPKPQILERAPIRELFRPSPRERTNRRPTGSQPEEEIGST